MNYFKGWQIANNRKVEQFDSSSENIDEDSNIVPQESSRGLNRLDSFDRKNSSSIREDYMSGKNFFNL